MTTHPRVGIVLTTYNGEDFLAAQLDSLLSQDAVSVHVHAFDDGSTDGTLAVLHRYASAHPGQFTVRQNKSNSGGTGLNIAQNAPLISATYDYVALADQDDVWLPRKLASAVEALSEQKASLYLSNLLAWDGNDETLGLVSKSAPMQRYDHLFGGGSAGCTYVMTGTFFSHVQDQLVAADLSGVSRLSHDWIIYFLARHYDHPVCISEDALIRYRIHTESQYGGMSLGGLAAFRRKFGMLRQGFLREQILNTLRFAREGTEDHEILSASLKGRRSRLKILAKYRFELVRERTRLANLSMAFLVME